jgi:coenzyme F420-reducing hydrogenase delta subunit
MCTGRIEPQHILRAFLSGLEAVMVLGCHPGECHYLTGNHHAARKVMMVAKLLDRIGLGSERLMLDWVSAAEGARFARLVAEFSGKVKGLGKLEIDGDLRNRIKAAEQTVMSENIRTLVAKQWFLEVQGNVYQEKLPREEFEQVLDAALEETYMKKLILETIKESALSVPDIVETTGERSETVSFHLASMWNRGEVILKEVEKNYPLFIRG